MQLLSMKKPDPYGELIHPGNPGVLTWHSDPLSDPPATTLANDGHFQGVTSTWTDKWGLPKGN